MTDTKSILCFSGHDPCGGAGIQADIEAIAAQACHAATVITCLTVQNTNDIQSVTAVDTALIEAQTRALTKDITFSAVKIGMLGSATTTTAIARLLTEIPGMPVVLDPILRSGGGSTTASQKTIEAINGQLLPLVTLMTPNQFEARQLSGKKDPAECAKWLQGKGCQQVLITGTDETRGDVIIHKLYVDERVYEYPVRRLPGAFHGSGCTLAASITAYLAQGNASPSAVELALQYTSETLRAAREIGHGQQIPRRILQ